LKVSIEQIKVRKRLREDIGSLGKLKESMRKHGLINPITINRKYELLAGYRRLQAARELGWHEIEASIVGARTRREKFNIEVDENLERKGFTPHEMELIDEMRKELEARGFMKIYYLIKRFFRWIKSLFSR
jgi:ParB family chromosome partitioning protein